MRGKKKLIVQREREIYQCGRLCSKQTHTQFIKMIKVDGLWVGQQVSKVEFHQDG